jgi:hypothetical protein
MSQDDGRESQKLQDGITLFGMKKNNKTLSYLITLLNDEYRGILIK